MSKNKGAAGSPSSTTITLSSSPSSSSLMSPRLEGLHDEVNGTPKQPEKKQPWQKFEPSPRCESPGTIYVFILLDQNMPYITFHSLKVILFG